MRLLTAWNTLKQKTCMILRWLIIFISQQNSTWKGLKYNFIIFSCPRYLLPAYQVLQAARNICCAGINFLSFHFCIICKVSYGLFLLAYSGKYHYGYLRRWVIQVHRTMTHWKLSIAIWPLIQDISCDRLISTMGFPILVRRHLYIESGPRASC